MNWRLPQSLGAYAREIIGVVNEHRFVAQPETNYWTLSDEPAPTGPRNPSPGEQLWQKSLSWR